MAQVSSYNVANRTGALVRADINDIYDAIKTSNSGTSDPSSPVKFMLYGDSTLNNNNLKIYDGAQFRTIGKVTEDNLGLLPKDGGTMTGVLQASAGSASAPAINFGDSGTGLYKVSTNVLGISCAGSNRFNFNTTEFQSKSNINLQKTDASDAYLQIRTTGNSNDAYIDLTTDSSSVGQDFGFRFLRQAGATGNSYLHHRSDDSNAGSLFILSQGGTNGSIIFGTGGTPHTNTSSDQPATERWRIDPTGCLGSNGLIASNALTNAGAFFNIQNTAFEGLSLVKNNNGWGTPLFIHRLTPYATGNLVEFQSNNTFCGSINTTSGSTTNFNTNVSDRTLKKNFESWSENTLDLFKSLNPQKYNFLHEDDKIEKNKGFIAQELADSFPEAYPQDDKGKYMFNPSGMVIYLMKALQESVAKIETLETKVAALEGS